MTQANKNTQALAQRINVYETTEKGFVGRIFGFEARDGLVSKTAKIYATAALGFGAAYMIAPIAAGFLGALAATGTTALAAGVGALAGRSVSGSIVQDMHDASNSRLGNAAHLTFTSGAAGLATVVALPTILFFGPTFLLGAVTNAALATCATLVPYGTSKLLKNIFGNSQNIQDSQDARTMAQAEISKEPSTDHIQEKSPRKAAGASAYINSSTPEEYAMLESQMHQSSQDHSFVEEVSHNNLSRQR